MKIIPSGKNVLEETRLLGWRVRQRLSKMVQGGHLWVTVRRTRMKPGLLKAWEGASGWHS